MPDNMDELERMIRDLKSLTEPGYENLDPNWWRAFCVCTVEHLGFDHIADAMRSQAIYCAKGVRMVLSCSYLVSTLSQADQQEFQLALQMAERLEI